MLLENCIYVGVIVLTILNFAFMVMYNRVYTKRDRKDWGV
jgi:hypothetical protein